MSSIPARRVLIPADLSSVTARAAAWARRFAAPGAAVEALYVYEAPPAPGFDLPMPPLAGLNKRRVLARLAKLVPGAAARVESGFPPSVILSRARRADLIVMGSHGRTGFERALLGSIAESVARDSPVPVLSVRTPPAAVRSILAPVNLMPYSFKGLLLAAEAAAFLGAELSVVHVAPAGLRGPNPRFFLNGMIARLPKALLAAVKPKVVLRAGDPVREILREARKHGLLVVTAHRKSLLADLVLGTTAERILRHSPVPVLSAPSGR